MASEASAATAWAEIDELVGDLQSTVADVDTADRLSYVFFLLSRLLETIGASHSGGHKLLKIFAGEEPTPAKKIGEVLSKLLETAANTSADLLKRYRGNLNVLFALTSKELARVLTTRPSGLIAPVTVQKVLGVNMTARPVAQDQLANTLKELYPRIGFGSDFRVTPGRNAGTQVSDPVPRGVVNVPWYEVTGVGTLNTTGQSTAAISRWGEIGMSGGSIFLGVWATIETVRNWELRPQRTTTAGQIAYDPRVQISHALMETIAGSAKLRSLFNKGAYNRAMTGDIFTKMFVTGADDFFTSAVTAVKSFAGASGASTAMRATALLGNIAGVVGIAISGDMAYEAFRTGDTISGVANTLMAVGGFVMLLGAGSFVGAVPGALIGGLIILAGLALSFANDDSREAWVRAGFWGISPNYWGDKRAKIKVLIERAKILATGDATMKGYFEQEMAAYYALEKQN